MADNSTKTGIERAIDVAGGQMSLARMLTRETGQAMWQPNISRWCDKGYVPEKYVKLISRVTGIPVDDLVRPEGRG
jgi:hypothetical protein